MAAGSPDGGRRVADPESLKREILALGFDRVGFAAADASPDYDRYADWLDAGNAAGMEYMRRTREQRRAPANLLPGARSVIMVSLNYHLEDPGTLAAREPGRGWVSRYAWGRDYHNVMRTRLRSVVRLLESKYGAGAARACVDTAPLLERSLAAAAGLGWIGRNTLLIDEELGSYTFLGAVLSDIELQSDLPVPDRCGSCTACIPACPTGALDGAGTLDSRLCISYLTIEHDGEIAPVLAEKMGEHLFGCDLCQEACPWNRKSPETTVPDFLPRDANYRPALAPLLELDRESMLARFAGSALMRAGNAGLSRNARIARDNQR